VLLVTPRTFSTRQMRAGLGLLVAGFQHIHATREHKEACRLAMSMVSPGRRLVTEPSCSLHLYSLSPGSFVAGPSAARGQNR